jgi:hypothetical protein
VKKMSVFSYSKRVIGGSPGLMIGRRATAPNSTAARLPRSFGVLRALSTTQDPEDAQEIYAMFNWEVFGLSLFSPSQY